jgi:hypothetical protein
VQTRTLFRAAGVSGRLMTPTCRIDRMSMNLEGWIAIEETAPDPAYPGTFIISVPIVTFTSTNRPSRVTI